MSDVPELDRLIAEADNVAKNRAIDRQDNLFSVLIFISFMSMLCVIPLTFAFGVIGLIISLCLFLLGLLPALAAVVFDIAVELLSPPKRDPTKRYIRK